MLQPHFGLVKIRTISIGWDFSEVYKCFQTKLKNKLKASTHVFSLIPPRWNATRLCGEQTSVLWFIRPLQTHVFIFHNPSSMDCFCRGVKRVGPWHFLSRPSSITRQSTRALTSPTWTMADVYRTDREYYQLRLLKVCYWHHNMLPHLKGCFEFILSANSLNVALISFTIKARHLSKVSSLSKDTLRKKIDYSDTIPYLRL